ncbi:MAG: hypothetical protein UT48_C0006G0028 [Parcubacteria group bacterium GW2011_GWE2_39_37]|uniref:Uncharacterized protein n=1 Tax=Candidatus Falkowbacteria bacterium GW2011_GWF2_39_8 TaxID=1618642 RepID=A0A0G0Q0L6_9BACT|nr:MAG: hypothetical protein UT48_C0006G0028 [Parcubacteria group bacterium GW2011_GWE2_39_37]KKR33889.1 MAG: hypothetical protein UT64_C0002G0028 [Candidatus Falkowbacteria bacterium GW2011_GWF2_39_8]
MINYKNWENEYKEGKTSECPHCSSEDNVHVCRNCYKDISMDICWQHKGVCEKCRNYIDIEIPKIEQIKKDLGVKCTCNDEHCAKCLLVNCKDENCTVHTNERKENFRTKYKNR